MTVEDLGAFFTLTDDGSLWRLTAYASEPTATLEQVYPPPATIPALWEPGEAFPTRMYERTAEPRRVGGVVGAPIFDGFVRLAPVGERPTGRTADDDHAEFWRGRPFAPDGVPSYSVTEHDTFARCPSCQNATVGLAPPFSINHADECHAAQALRVYHGMA